jgi:hypothetical protein
MPTWLLGIKGLGIAALAGATLASGATFYVTSLGYRMTISNMEKAAAEGVAQAHKEALDQFALDAKLINEAAGGHVTDVSTLNRRMAGISKDLRDAIAANPLPDACPALDAGRLSALKAATQAANSSSGSNASPAVPANP